MLKKIDQIKKVYFRGSKEQAIQFKYKMFTKPGLTQDQVEDGF